MKNTIRAKLVAARNASYTEYVFQNLDVENNNMYRYITVVKCPNWQNTEPLKVGDTGYLNFEYAKADEEYYDVSTDSMKKYRYTANYFMNFIKESKQQNQKEFNF